MLETIVVENPSRNRNQTIEEEWRPKFCNDCIKLGQIEDEFWFKHPYMGKELRLNKKDWK